MPALRLSATNHFQLFSTSFFSSPHLIALAVCYVPTTAHRVSWQSNMGAQNQSASGVTGTPMLSGITFRTFMTNGNSEVHTLDARVNTLRLHKTLPAESVARTHARSRTGLGLGQSDALAGQVES
ncbi:MAG: hypothetical protein KC588_15055 [Nitrospira sp.]|nr:hypothetical protein [Nitrospira sp.]